MFIINQVLKADKIPAGKGEELFKQHIAWFTKHFEQGDFLLVGPYTDKKMAGIMISSAETREAVEEILREDVYYAGGMADYEVRSFKAAMISPSLADCAGK
jgi:uncharacterized protein YciI